MPNEIKGSSSLSGIFQTGMEGYSRGVKMATEGAKDFADVNGDQVSGAVKIILGEAGAKASLAILSVGRDLYEAISNLLEK